MTHLRLQCLEKVLNQVKYSNRSTQVTENLSDSQQPSS